MRKPSETCIVCGNVYGTRHCLRCVLEEAAIERALNKKPTVEILLKLLGEKFTLANERDALKEENEKLCDEVSALSRALNDGNEDILKLERKLTRLKGRKK